MTNLNVHLGMLGLQGPELIVIVLVLLLLFGAKKLPELAKGLGQGIKEFKRATKDVQSDLHQAMDADDRSAQSYSTRPPAPSPAIPSPSDSGIPSSPETTSETSDVSKA